MLAGGYQLRHDASRLHWAGVKDGAEQDAVRVLTLIFRFIAEQEVAADIRGLAAIRASLQCLPGVLRERAALRLALLLDAACVQPGLVEEQGEIVAPEERGRVGQVRYGYGERLQA